MCQFISWKEYQKEVYFLTNADLDTKAGKELLEPEYVSDLCGHGAIEHYYPELKGKGENKECTDFSTPKNFPKAIVTALKAGKLSRIGICLDILNKQGIKEYEKIRQSALAKYQKIQQPALAKYQKIEQSAYAEYNKIITLTFNKIVKQKKYRTKEWK